jgi:hypothetical protein
MNISFDFEILFKQYALEIIVPFHIIIMTNIRFIKEYFSDFLLKYLLAFGIYNVIFSIFLVYIGFGIKFGVFWIILIISALATYLVAFIKVKPFDYEGIDLPDNLDKTISRVIGIVIILLAIFRLINLKLGLLIDDRLDIKVSILSSIIYLISGLCIILLNKDLARKVKARIKP